MSRNPSWTRDEIILGLDVYLRNIRRRTISTSNEDILFLSRFLNDSPIHLKDKKDINFRNPDGVKMRVLNFTSLDPDYLGKGLVNAGKSFAAVWNDFYYRPDYLHRVAMAIIACHPLPFEYRTELNSEDTTFLEGSILYQYHRHIELDGERTVRLYKEIGRNGYLTCSICGFDFEQIYGQAFIEFHYFNSPVNFVNGMRIVDNDFGPICSNCHRMIHRFRPWLLKSERVKLIRR